MCLCEISVHFRQTLFRKFENGNESGGFLNFYGSILSFKNYPPTEISDINMLHVVTTLNHTNLFSHIYTREIRVALSLYRVIKNNLFQHFCFIIIVIILLIFIPR